MDLAADLTPRPERRGKFLGPGHPQYGSDVEFRLLGPFEIVDDERTIPIAGRKERALLAVLLSRPGQVLPADRLIELLWGTDRPMDAANTLQAVVARLRKALGPRGKDVLVTRKPGYALAVDAEQVDAARFERLVVRGRDLIGRDPVAASSLLRQALDMWRGPALQDLADVEPVAQEITRLEELHLSAVEERIEADLRLGRHAGLVAELRTLVTEQPFRERLRRQLMLALYRLGRQGDAVLLYEETRRLLAEELGVDPGSELQALHEAILRQDPSLLAWERPRATARHNLPARITSFVGRALELAEVRRLLRRSRLLTVIGPGGAGKTSLAIEVARAVAESDEAPAGGLFLVELGSLSDPEQVPHAVADALGLRGVLAGGATDTDTTPEAQLEDFARAKEPLLLLDNCEHLVDAVARLAERLLRAAPGLKVLSTSREPLGLVGEVAWSIPGLATPAGATSADSLRDYDAARLFEERAAASRPGFELDDQTAPATAEICRRLDGIPLAIELAAARARTLPVHEIARRLDDRFHLLTGGARTAVPRQQTLRATIDWSHDLLTDSERVLLARLSVFASTWDLDAAEAVCADEALPALHIMDLVLRLADRSLIMPEHGRTARFRMLETIHEYARERLAEAGGLQELHQRHADHFLEVAQAAGTQPALPGRLKALDDAGDDIRAALDWALAMRADDALFRFAGALGWYWATWRQREGLQWMHAILTSAQPAASAEFGRALQASAFVESYTPSTGTRDRARRSVDLLERSGDRSGATRSQLIQAFIELMLGGDPSLAASLVDAAEHTLRAVGDEWGEALAALSRFRLYLHTGLLERSIGSGREALRRFQALEDAWGTPWTTMWLAVASRMLGDTEDATRLLREAIASAEQLPYVTCYAHAELGSLAALRGDHHSARAHHQTALEVAPETGVRDALAMTQDAAGFGARLRDDPAEARARHHQALGIHEELGAQIGIAHSLCGLGFAEHALGNAEQARQHLNTALRLAYKTGRLELAAAALEGLAREAAPRSAETCAVLLGSARSIRDATGIRLTLIEGHDPAEAQLLATSVLGPQRTSAAMETGKSLSRDQVLALAFDAAGGAARPATHGSTRPAR